MNNKDWRKSSFSGAGNDCVYLGRTGGIDGPFGICDSKSGKVLNLRTRELLALAKRS